MIWASGFGFGVEDLLKGFQGLEHTSFLNFTCGLLRTRAL